MAFEPTPSAEVHRLDVLLVVFNLILKLVPKAYSILCISQRINRGTLRLRIIM